MDNAKNNYSDPQNFWPNEDNTSQNMLTNELTTRPSDLDYQNSNLCTFPEDEENSETEEKFEGFLDSLLTNKNSPSDDKESTLVKSEEEQSIDQSNPVQFDPLQVTNEDSSRTIPDVVLSSDLCTFPANEGNFQIEHRPIHPLKCFDQVILPNEHNTSQMLNNELTTRPSDLDNQYLNLCTSPDDDGNIQTEQNFQEHYDSIVIIDINPRGDMENILETTEIEDNIECNPSQVTSEHSSSTMSIPEEILSSFCTGTFPDDEGNFQTEHIHPSQCFDQATYNTVGQVGETSNLEEIGAPVCSNVQDTDESKNISEM